MSDWFNLLTGNEWQHYIPFAALVAKQPIPENRPAATRIIEQGFVGLIASAVTLLATVQIMQNDIEALKKDADKREAIAAKAVADSEVRVTSQIQELRSIMLRANR